MLKVVILRRFIIASVVVASFYLAPSRTQADPRPTPTPVPKQKPNAQAARVAELVYRAFGAIWMDSDWEEADIEAEVRRALDGGVSPNARDEYGDTLLLQAIENNRPTVARLLLRRGADVNLSDTNPLHGDTPLTRAITTHDVWTTGAKPLTPLVKMLLQRRADPNRANREGERPLTLAAIDGQGDIVALLLKAGANFRLRNKDGLTPLALASVDVPPGSMTIMGGGFAQLTRPNDPKQVERDIAAHRKAQEQWSRSEERRLSKGRAQVKRLLKQAGAKE